MKRRILVRAPNWLGDLVMALPAIRKVRQMEADSLVTLHVPRGRLDLARSWGVVDEVLGVDVKGALGVLRAARWIGRRWFDAALLLTNSFSSALLARLVGAREAWGYSTDARSLLLSRRVRPNRELPQPEYYAGLVAALYDEPLGQLRPEDFAFEVPVEWRRKARELAGEGSLVAVAPGSAYGPAKEWPEESFAEVCRMLIRAGCSCVLVGSAKQRAKCGRIAALAPGARSLAGRTDIMILAGLLAEAEAFIGNDSGAAHLAAAVGTKTVAIFGSTRPGRTSPRGRAVKVIQGRASCIPCASRVCPRGSYECLKDVTAREVFEALTGAGWD